MKSWEQYSETNYPYPTYCSFCGIQMVQKEFLYMKRKSTFVCYCPDCHKIDFPNAYHGKPDKDLMKPCYDMDGRLMSF